MPISASTLIVLAMSAIEFTSSHASTIRGAADNHETKRALKKKRGESSKTSKSSSSDDSSDDGPFQCGDVLTIPPGVIEVEKVEVSTKLDDGVTASSVGLFGSCDDGEDFVFFSQVKSGELRDTVVFENIPIRDRCDPDDVIISVNCFFPAEVVPRTSEGN